MFLGIFAGGFADYLKEFAPYDLLIMMTVSFSAVSFKSIFNIKSFLKNALIAFLLNYLLFGCVLMLLTYMLLPASSPMIYGFLFIALAPPGVVIVPFSQKVNGNEYFSIIGTIGGYIIQIVVFPLLVIFLDIQKQIPIGYLLWQFTLMLILPLIISRFIRFKKAQNFLAKSRGRIIDVTFFILIYIVIGLTRNVFLNNLFEIVMPVIILLIMFFPIIWIFENIMKRLNICDSDQKSYTLMFVVKNNGVSALLALLIVGPNAAIPSAALSVILLIFLLLFLNKHRISLHKI